MITVSDLSKRYDSTLALDHFSLQVPAGAVFGLLGPNGAGKTTLLRLLMGLLKADAGQIDRGGLSPAQIGYLPERAFYPTRLTVASYLSTVARLAGLKPDPERLLAEVGLEGLGRRRLGACSRGMLQRVGLAQALLGDPSLFLLDEPALGLDPAGQKFMRDRIVALKNAGKTILLSSHHLDEVTRVCSHVAVVSQGHMVRSGPLATILVERSQVIIRTAALPPGTMETLAALDPDIRVSAEQVLLQGQAMARKSQVLRLLLDDGIDVRQLSEERATLEEIYLQATA